ncbi:MAG TPA: nitrogen fixation negative regulator NifL [Kaistiaceae bacterium]|nr:nitrogen fixation negative regulator NifL [Kaistiaceae bacterium]
MTDRKYGEDGQSTTEALTAVLTSLPEDLPPEIRRIFGEALSPQDHHLPPRLYQEAVEAMSVAVSITDRDATILYVNPAFEALTGYAAEEVVGKNESLLSNKRTPHAVYVELWEVIGSGRVWQGRLINRKRDGDLYLAELSIVPVKNRAGAIGYYLGLHRDITEMHHLQRKVENQKNLIESILDSAPVAIVLIDLKGAVLVGNRAYRRLAADMAGIEPAGYFIGQLRAQLGGDLVDASAEERTFAGAEVRWPQGGGWGGRWFSCSSQWVREFELSADTYFETKVQDAMLLVISEITGLKRQYEQTRFMAVHSQMTDLEMRLTTREMIDGALYQLQGPLNIIQAMAGMLQRRDGEDAHLLHAVDEAMSSGNRAMERLRVSLPPLSREVMSPVNLNQVIRDVLVLSADRLSASGIVVDWQPDRDLPPVFGQENLLRILIKVFVDNAITAVGEPGARSREVRVSTAADEEFIQLCVRDGGPGIDRAARSNVFEPFYSGWTRSPRSAGMGLAIAQQILTELGGDVEIEVTQPHGSAIRIWLPSCRARKGEASR